MQREKDQALSRRIQAALRTLPYQCWHNAKRALAYLSADAWYVEGWVVTAEGRVVEHGWCESGGWIVDPTLPEARMVYFAGLRFDAQQIATLDHDPHAPIVWQLYGPGGCGSPEYRAVFVAACRFAETSQTSCA